MTDEQKKEALDLSKEILKVIGTRDQKVAGYALTLALELVMFTMGKDSEVEK
jgi:predicted nucleic acid-binding protein